MRKIDVFLVLTTICFCPSLTPAAEKLRLSDIPDETDKRSEEKVRKNEQSQEMTPEERKRVTEQLADDAYIDGMKAERAGQLKTAKRYFETALGLSPNHGQARQGVARMTRMLRPAPNLAATPVAAPKSDSTAVRKASAGRPTPKPTLSAQETKEKSESLYLKALSAAQNGDFEEAYKLCRESLKLDPENLQARRMAERLELRMNKS